MADKDLDLDTENAGKSKTNLLIIILIVVILAVGGGVAAMFLLGGDDEESASKDTHAAADAQHAAPAHAIYSNMRPTFVINFEDTSKARYIQIDLVVMARQQHSIDLVQEHSPVIRNNIITILSSQNYTELNTRKGKEKLQAMLLKSINDTITAEVTNTPTPVVDSEHPAPVHAPGSSYIEAVYFTSLVMQ